MQICPVLFASLLFPLTILSLAIEPFSISFNSRNITLLNQSGSSNRTFAYRAECALIHNRPDLPNFHEDACTEAIPFACGKLTDFEPQFLVRDRWIWTNRPGCSLAYFVPMAAEPASIPTKQECEAQVYGYMVKECVSSHIWDLGTINVFSPPTPGDSGSAFLQDYPRYLVSSKQLDTGAPPV